MMDDAFSGCSGLTSITIPDSVTSIGDDAFYNCSGLTSVTIPDSVTSIGSSAFEGCSGLTSITIPNSVTSIGSYAFSGCSGLTSVTIPDSVTSIYSSAFEGCSGLTSVTIPDGVTSIGYDAFSGCSGLTSVTIPDSVTSIRERAFSECSGLTSITIPDGVTSIGFRTFYKCSGLTSITIPNSVTSIGNSAFYNCSSLTSVTIGDSVTSIGDYAFYDCRGLTSVTIGDSVTSIGDYAFYDCRGLTSVTIGDSVTSIGGYAFSYCSGLTSVTIPDSVTSIGDEAFLGCNDFLYDTTTIQGVKLVDGWVVDYTDFCPSVLDLTGVRGIVGRAFYNCSGLTSITIPNSVTSIGGYAFSGCNNIKSVTVGQYICSKGLDVFPSYQSITNVVILEGVTSIAYYAFYNCSGLTSVTIPDSVTSIGAEAFRGCSGLTSVTISDSVTSIGWGAFFRCGALTCVTMTIGDSVTSIGDEAFGDCYNIKSVTVGQYICSKGLDVFPSYRSITNVVISEGVTSIEDRAFYNCSDLTSITIPDGVTSIGDNAFYGCSGLTSVTIPNSVTSIGLSVFDGCTSLKSVTIGAGVSNIDNSLFSNCPNMEYVVLPESFVGKVDFEGIQEVYSNYKCVIGGDAIWFNDNDVTSDKNGSLRSGKISDNQSTYLEMYVEGAGRLSYKWKASSEYYDEDIFDYGYLSLDGVNLSSYDSDNYRLSGIGIGGDTDWQYVELDVSTSGSHIFRWTYCKDEIDESNVGEDCIWVDEIKYQPMNVIIFDIGGGMGTDPAPINALSESNVALPSDSGFAREDFVFAGWSDGIKTYQAGETYVMPLTNITMTAQWIAKKFLTFNLGDGEGASPSVIKEIPGTTVMLPNSEGFSRKNYSFAGWSDGVKTYSAGGSFVVGDSDITFTALWSANTLNAPTIMSDEVVNGGVLTSASSVISITSEDDTEIYYTTDGTTPSASSAKYDKPFVVDTLGVTIIKAIAVRDNYFDSEVSTFTFSRIPHSIDECLNADGLTLTTGGTSNWYRVVGDVAHDGIAALRSGAIGDNELTFVKATVSGKGTISFWWKSSSEINRKRKYDYVSFTVVGVEQAWLGGDTDWTNIVCEIAAAGVHTLEWTYQKNASNIMFEDCAWLDEVSWMPSSQGEAIPELPSSATADDVAYVLADSTDANLVKNITSIEMYSAYREWALSVKNASGDEVAGVEAVKASTTAWMSFALDQSRLIANEPVEGDVSIASLDTVETDGAFEFTVNIDKIDVGDGAVEENLKKLFKIEGTTALGNDANFSSENVEIELAEPVNGDVKFKILPKDSPDSFFIRAKLLK